MMSYHINVPLRCHQLRNQEQNEDSSTDSAIHSHLPKCLQKLQKICMTCPMMRILIPALMMVNCQLDHHSYSSLVYSIIKDYYCIL